MRASIDTLMTRAYRYRGGRKGRRAYKRLVQASRKNPWLIVGHQAAVYGKIISYFYTLAAEETPTPSGEPK